MRSKQELWRKAYQILALKRGSHFVFFAYSLRTVLYANVDWQE